MLRKKKNMSQQDMGKFLGMTRQGYAKYENGESEPDMKTLNKIADFFGVSTDYLYGRMETSNENRYTEVGISNEDYQSLSEYQKEVIDFFLTRENLFFKEKPENLLEALKQFEVYYEVYKKMQDKN